MMFSLSEEMESACKIQEPMELYPFGYRTHTHKLGKLVSGWLVRGNNWSLIGKHDPQQPQVNYFYLFLSIILTEISSSLTTDVLSC